MKDNDWLELAIEIARTNPITKLPKMGAVLITSDKDIFVGRNQLKTHPYQAEWGARVGKPRSLFLHAETAAILRALKGNMEQIDAIYIARVSKRGIPALARPCSVCWALLAHFNVRKLVWT